MIFFQQNKKGDSQTTLIATLLLVLLIATVVLSYRSYQREKSQLESRIVKVCYANLNMLEGAAEMYLLEVPTTSKRQVTMDNLIAKGYFKRNVTCPKQGEYSITVVGEDYKDIKVICSIHGELPPKPAN
jgi:competence protein ComGC